METNSRTTRPASTTESKTTQPVHRHNFATADECARLIDCWELYRDSTTRETGPAKPFDQRVLHVNEVYALDDELGRLLLDLAGRTARVLAEGYDTSALFPDDVQIVKWWKGHSMRPHADKEHPDGSPHGTPWRDYAAVVYLNDAYSGGQVVFPIQRMTIKPEAGDLVAFRGDRTAVHGVMPITGGVRYTCPAWFTTDARHSNALYLEHVG